MSKLEYVLTVLFFTLFGFAIGLIVGLEHPWRWWNPLSMGIAYAIFGGLFSAWMFIDEIY